MYRKAMNRNLITMLAAVCVVAFSWPAFGGLVHEVDFSGQGADTVVGGKVTGGGWTSTSPEFSGKGGEEAEAQYVEVGPGAAVLASQAGSLHFTVKRTDGSSQMDYDSVVALLDDRNDTILSFNIVWDAGQDRGTALYINGLENPVRDGLWNNWVYLGSEVSVGGTLEVTVVWGPSKGDNRVYFNGRKARVVYDPKSVAVAPGGPAKVFADYVDGTVSRVLVGVDTSVATGRATYWSPLNTSLVTSVAFHDTTTIEPVANIIADAPWGGENEVSWTASPSVDVVHYDIYRGEGAAPDFAAVPFQSTSALSYTDTEIIAGLEYFYAVKAVDAAGNASPPSDIVSVVAIAGEGPTISGVTIEPADRPVRPGESVTITLSGQTGGTARAEIEGLIGDMELVENGTSGTYTGSYVVTEAEVAEAKVAYRIIGKLRDDFGASSVAGPELSIIGLDVLNDTTAPVVADVSHDGFGVAGFSGALVPGDVLTVTLEGETQGYASFELTGVTGAVTMAEVDPGVYKGSHTIGWDDEGAGVAIKATLADEAGNTTSLTAAKTVEIDSRVRLMATVRDGLLPADSESETRIVVRAEDANGDEVSGHELALTLSTTAEYTGVVGGGRIEDQLASIEDADDIEVKWDGVTDAFGEVAATYTAGFAAKTALIVVKDLTTGDVGAGWLNTYVASTVAIQLNPQISALAASAQLRMSVNPGWLTADGRSKARVRAWLTDMGGQPIEGAKVVFAVGSDNGSVRVLRGVTNSEGLAEADYRAGTLAGFVTITAEADAYNAAQSAQIELKSDAPAKIDLVASVMSLPADGRSTTALTALVSDINDNVNPDVPVLFTVLEGGGEVTPETVMTDVDGKAAASYTAGRNPGTALVEARHTSRAPTQEELQRVYGTIFVPRLYEDQERDRFKVDEWLVDEEDEVVKGQPVVRIETRDGDWTLTAPQDGVFVRKVRFKRDRIELGETLGYVEVDAEVWAETYAE